MKICGITSVEDGVAAARLGADAIGLNFYPPSPRALDVSVAAEIDAALPPFVIRVALFVNPRPDEVERVLTRVRDVILQFHGNETAEFCAGFGRPYIKTIGMRSDIDLPAAAREFTGAKALLLDAYDPILFGGTGRSFDWSAAKRDLGKPIILAGGLDAGNVAAAIETARPYAVDVCGGVERSPGVKDHDRLAAFIGTVRRSW